MVPIHLQASDLQAPSVARIDVQGVGPSGVLYHDIRYIEYQDIRYTS